MGCCLFVLLMAGAPRLAFVLWWLVQPLRMDATFDTFLLPLVGVIFAPWTTIMYVLVFPSGISGFDWVFLGLAVLLDISTYGGGARAQMQRTAGPGSGPMTPTPKV